MHSFRTAVPRLGGALISALVACIAIHAQAPAQTSPAQLREPAAIAHVAVRVADLAKSREFYEHLGFEEAFALDQGGTPTEAFLKVNDRQFIELYPQSQPTQPVGFLHVCFESADLEALNRFYLTRGLAPTPVRRAGAGNLLFTMEGPEKQNIEYTQYMPGSRHTNDRGMHLGAHRIADRIAGVGIVMQDSIAASAFYTEKLGFSKVRSFVHAQDAFALPGDAAEQVEFISPAPGANSQPGAGFDLEFAVPNLRRTAAQLKSIGIAGQKRGKALAIVDPDGNRILFVESKG